MQPSQKIKKKKKSVDKDAQEAKGILKKKCMDKDAQEAREYEPNL